MLGNWQSGRADQKRAAAARLERVVVEGEFLPRYTVYLDNKTRRGRAGYEIVTPLRLRGAASHVLVNRGWVPFSGYRDQLPDVSLAPSDAAARNIRGRLEDLPAAGLASGRSPPVAGPQWPKLTSFPTRDELAAALGGERGGERPLNGRDRRREVAGVPSSSLRLRRWPSPAPGVRRACAPARGPCAT